MDSNMYNGFLFNRWYRSQESNEHQPGPSRRSRRKMAAYGGHLAPSLLPPCWSTYASAWSAACYLRSILWSIDSCQMRVSADQYHMNISRAQARANRDLVFRRLMYYPDISFRPKWRAYMKKKHLTGRSCAQWAEVGKMASYFESFR